MTLLTILCLTTVAFLVALGALLLVMRNLIRDDTLRRPSGMFTGFGVRTPSTLASDEAWRAGHRAIVRFVLVGAILGIGGAVAALVGLAVVGDTVGFAIGIVATTLEIILALVITLVASTVAAKTLVSDPLRCVPADPNSGP